MEWDDLELVLAICRSGTLAGAARALGINHSTVFRRINAIEKKLGVRLFERFARGYRMTGAGEEVQRVAERVESEILGLSRKLVGQDLRLQGKLRVTVPEGVGLGLLTPYLAEFCTHHPEIQLDLAVTNSALRLTHREADVAVRVTRQPPETSIGRCICHFRFAVYASPKYLLRNPNESLETHRWALWEDSTDLLPGYLKHLGPEVERNIVLRSNSTTAVISAAQNHVGAALLPCFLGDVARGLVRVTEPLEELTVQLWILTHSDLRDTARVRALMTFLTEALEDQKTLIEGAGKG